MRSRGLVVVLAVVLASLATGAVFMYTRSVRSEATSAQVTVVVSKVDVPANTDLDELVQNETFTTAEVAKADVVEGAITDVSQLKGAVNNAAILAGEQIPLARIQGNLVEGGALGIPKGHEALTLALAAPRVVGESLAVGDTVTVYGTFAGNAGTAATEPRTVVLVPTVEVLRMVNLGGTGESTTNPNNIFVQVTLALTPTDAQKVVFAQELGAVYVALLPPGEDGKDAPPVSFAQVVK